MVVLVGLWIEQGSMSNVSLQSYIQRRQFLTGAPGVILSKYKLTCFVQVDYGTHILLEAYVNSMLAVQVNACR